MEQRIDQLLVPHIKQPTALNLLQWMAVRRTCMSASSTFPALFYCPASLSDSTAHSETSIFAY